MPLGDYDLLSLSVDDAGLILIICNYMRCLRAYEQQELAVLTHIQQYPMSSDVSLWGPQRTSNRSSLLEAVTKLEDCMTNTLAAVNNLHRRCGQLVDDSALVDMKQKLQNYESVVRLANEDRIVELAYVAALAQADKEMQAAREAQAAKKTAVPSDLGDLIIEQRERERERKAKHENRGTSEAGAKRTKSAHSNSP